MKKLLVLAATIAALVAVAPVSADTPSSDCAYKFADCTYLVD